MMVTKSNTKTRMSLTHHEVASFHFLPFVVDMFSRRELRMTRTPFVPVGQAQDLTLQVVEALIEVVRRGTLAFLCRAGGWRALSVAQSGVDQPWRDVRICDDRLWKGLELRYGDESVDALIMAFNAVCGASGQTPPSTRAKKKGEQSAYPTSKTLSFARNGDMLVHHIAFVKLRNAPFHVDKKYWDFFAHNPLTMLVRLDATRHPEEALERLWGSDLDVFFPWLAKYMASSWEMEMKTRWKSLKRFQDLNEGGVTYFEALFAAAKERDRRDLLVPLLFFFKKHLGKDDVPKLWLNEFNRIAKDLRFADRDVHRRTWGHLMQLGWKLQAEYTAARSIHPIDRESPDRVFMEEFEHIGFEEVAEEARVLSNQLRSVIS